MKNMMDSNQAHRFFNVDGALVREDEADGKVRYYFWRRDHWSLFLDIARLTFTGNQIPDSTAAAMLRDLSAASEDR